MAKKLATQILRDSRNRQLILDQLDQTVQTFQSTTNNDAFNSTAKTASALNVALIINALRTAVEAQLMTALGKSYTNTTYTAGTYIVASPVPQFLSVKEIQEYYTNKIAIMIKDITDEHVETQFVNDGLGQGTNVTVNPPSPNPHPVGNAANIPVNKGSTWLTGETTILGYLNTLNAAIMAYVPL